MLQLKVDSDQQIFKKIFVAISFTFKVFSRDMLKGTLVSMSDLLEYGDEGYLFNYSIGYKNPLVGTTT